MAASGEANGFARLDAACSESVTFRASRHGQTDSWSKNFALKGPCNRFDFVSAVMPLPDRQRRRAVMMGPKCWPEICICLG